MSSKTLTLAKCEWRVTPVEKVFTRSGPLLIVDALLRHFHLQEG